jgi:FkbM family methyltransferase
VSSALRACAGFVRSLAIYRARPWKQARLVEFYRGFVRPGDLAFDIGAHVGNRTLALKACGAHVVALEPQRLFYRFLQHTVPDEVTLLPIAAGARAGCARLAVSSLHPTVSSLKPGLDAQLASAPGFENVVWDDEAWVGVTTLDNLIRDHGRPSFVKIDVEGFEAEVLEGLSLAVPWLAFEYLAADLATTRTCLERLNALGTYAYNFTCGEEHAFSLPEWTSSVGILAALENNRDKKNWGDVYARLKSAT